jgi:predicted nucleic-acid-binding protein
VRIADTVVFEAVFVLQHSYRQPKAAIREYLLPLLELPGIILPGKRWYRKVFDHYVECNISFADAYHATLVERLKLTEVVSFDTEFNRVPGITRVEP